MAERHLYSDEFDTYVAESLEQANEFMLERTGMTREDAEKYDCWLTPVDDDKKLRVYQGEDDGCMANHEEFEKNSVEKTAREWAAEQPLGFFCSTEC